MIYNNLAPEKSISGMMYEDQSRMLFEHISSGDNAIYVGEWKCNQRHGWGKMKWFDESEYDGEWRFDKRFLGTMTMIDSSVSTLVLIFSEI
jgi:hypothetical protein